MPRLTHKVFSDLAIWMTGFGLTIGIIFPFFVVRMGVPADIAYTPWFFTTCMVAGFIVSTANIWLARVIVGRRLKTLASHMHMVEKNLREMAVSGDSERCTPETCYITVDSEDEIGESSRAFNYLVEALVLSHQNDAAVRMFTDMLASRLELETLAQDALDQLLQYTDADAGAVLIASEGEVQIVAAKGISNPDNLMESDQVQLALQSEKRLEITGSENVFPENVLTSFRPLEILLEPLVYKGFPLGVLILARAEKFTTTAKNLLDKFLPSLAIAFNNGLTHDRLQRLAALDPLTGVYNRRFGLARLREEFGRVLRSSGPLGLIMFDIDHFKKVNDTYGHIVGDRVLMQITRTAKAALREGDVIMRYGGEEFMVILPAASRENSCEVGERLRRILEKTAIKEGAQVIRITISLGITSYPEFEAESEEDLVKGADEALYLAKESGRNQIVCT